MVLLAGVFFYEEFSCFPVLVFDAVIVLDNIPVICSFYEVSTGHDARFLCAHHADQTCPWCFN